MRIPRPLVYLWTLPTTLTGVWLLPLAYLTGGSAQVIEGVLEIHGGIVAWLLAHCPFLRGGASAMTLGHVVLARDQLTAEHTRKHERVHVAQAERWGPFFLPAYLLASLIALVRGKRPYLDNPFEREAYDIAG